MTHDKISFADDLPYFLAACSCYSQKKLLRLHTRPDRSERNTQSSSVDRRTGEYSDVKVLARTIEILGNNSGFNYGRLDVRAKSAENFWNGEFIALEVNGVDSLATNIFDPSWSIFDAYRQLFRQYDVLLGVALEQRDGAMALLPVTEIIKRTIESEKLLLRNHNRIIELGLR